MASGYSLYQGWTRARDKLVSTLIRGQFADFGSRTVLAHPIRMSGVERVRVGSDVYIGAGSWIQVVDHPETPKGVVIDIADGVRMSGLCVVSGTSSIVIEEGALFARNVYVADHGHAFDGADAPIREQGIDHIEPVRVGAGAWLGQNVVLMPGAQVGRLAVIGANSVVRGSIPDRAVAVGAPARVVRTIGE